jgi:hypothetical protein
MVGDLLFNLYGQRIRNCGNITLATLIRNTLVIAQSISVETVSYALSLVSYIFIQEEKHVIHSHPLSF